MLRADQVKPYLIHPERVVKNFAVKYFRESFNHDADLMPLVLQSVVADPQDPDNAWRLTQAKRFRQTPFTVAELLKRIKTDTRFALEYNEILVNCDLDSLALVPNVIASLNPVTAQKIASRKTIAGFSTVKLWKEFQRDRVERDDSDESYDCDYGSWLIKELAQRSDFSPTEVIACLDEQYSDDYDGYAELYLCELIGELKLQAGMNYLLQSLAKPDELLNETAMEALIKLGTVEVIQAVEFLYSQATPECQIYIVGVLENIKLPEAEAALIRLLPVETDSAIAALLAEGLCNLGSEKAIPMLRKMVYQGYDRDMLCLEESLYVNCLINGKELPEMSRWRELIAENFAEFDAYDPADFQNDDFDQDEE